MFELALTHLEQPHRERDLDAAVENRLLVNRARTAPEALPARTHAPVTAGRASRDLRPVGR